MAQYRKKPVVIEAFQITEETRNDNRDWPSWLHQAWNKRKVDEGAVFPLSKDESFGKGLCIHTKEGIMNCSIGDYIIRGVQGELYACKPDIFEATYEPVN